jgi:hypothetical protein
MAACGGRARGPDSLLARGGQALIIDGPVIESDREDARHSCSIVGGRFAKAAACLPTDCGMRLGAMVKDCANRQLLHQT